MIDTSRLRAVLGEYKKDFVSTTWGEERYKWEAVKHFQDNWDLNDPDFPDMLERSLAKTANLLTSYNYLPKSMITELAQNNPESVRSLFISLFDENQEYYERVEAFKQKSKILAEEYGKQSYQKENAITTYLWLRYPDKYYIYKFTEAQAVAEDLKSNYRIKKGTYAENLRNHLALYNEISAELQKDTELVELLQSQLTSDCYPDPQLRTLTIDVGFYISRTLPQKIDVKRKVWFPLREEYEPGLSVDEWLSILSDKSVFTDSALEIMRRLKDYGGKATCTQLSLEYGKTANFYNAGSVTLARRVVQKTGCPVMASGTDESKWWPVLYTGRPTQGKEEGSYIWKLRDELSSALDRFDLSKVPLYVSESPQLKAIVSDTYTKDDFLQEVYMTEERSSRLMAVLKSKKNLILQGAPGVGKTFCARRLAWLLMGEKDNNRIEFVQFHQNYSYEDFVMGYKPAEEGFELKNGIFYRFCQQAANQPDKDFFFIIDEINRGNLSKILGELLMLIERDYREHEATLAYSGQPFSVPENLYLIGMMNTADRSLAMIDYALRRRFSFFEMEPGFNSQGFTAYLRHLDNPVLDELVEKIRELNTEIANDKSLGPGFRIGHSYLCGRDDCDEEWLRDVVDFDILPMLSEYWFDNADKVKRWENELQGIFQ